MYTLFPDCFRGGKEEIFSGFKSKFPLRVSIGHPEEPCWAPQPCSLRLVKILIATGGRRRLAQLTNLCLDGFFFHQFLVPQLAEINGLFQILIFVNPAISSFLTAVSDLSELFPVCFDGRKGMPELLLGCELEICIQVKVIMPPPAWCGLGQSILNGFGLLNLKRYGLVFLQEFQIFRLIVRIAPAPADKGAMLLTFGRGGFRILITVLALYKKINLVQLGT